MRETFYIDGPVDCMDEYIVLTIEPDGVISSATDMKYDRSECEKMANLLYDYLTSDKDETYIKPVIDFMHSMGLWIP